MKLGYFEQKLDFGWAEKYPGKVIKPVEGMTGWGDGAETMGWGADETPSQSNIDEPEQPSQVEVINIGTEKHVPIPEFYEETIEVTEREIPGTGSSERKKTLFSRGHKLSKL